MDLVATEIALFSSKLIAQKKKSNFCTLNVLKLIKFVIEWEPQNRFTGAMNYMSGESVKSL